MLPHEHDIMRVVEDNYWWYQVLRRHIVQSIGPTEESFTLLDVGCGTGGTLQAVRRRYAKAQLFGVDLSEHAIGHCKARQLHASIMQASAEKLPFASETFDYVLSIDVLTAATLDPNTALREAWRVLRPNGTIILNVAALDFLRGAHNVAVAEHRRFKRRNLRRLLEKAGFEIRQLTYWNALLLPPIAAWRLLSRAQTKRGPARSDFYILPRVINTALDRLVGAELKLLRFVSLPFGTSLFGIGTRTERVKQTHGLE